MGKVNRAELLAAIAKVKPGLAKKVVIEQATHLIFTNDELVTFNDQLCIMHPFKIGMNFSVKEDEFSKIVGSTKEEFVEIAQVENGITIKAKGLNGKMNTILGEEAKVEHLIAAMTATISKPDAFKPLPKEFLDGVYLCSFSANKDVATGVRSCVAVQNDQVFSTDNIRVSSYILDTGLGDGVELLISGKDAGELSKYPVVEYAMSDNWLHFRTKDGIVFNCKTMKGDYPFKMVASIIANVDSELTFPAELKDLITSVAGLADGEEEVNKTVRLTAKNKTIYVKAEREKSMVERDMPFDYTGPDFSFLINPIFFAQVLNHATGFVLLENSRAQFASENFYHVLGLPTE